MDEPDVHRRVAGARPDRLRSRVLTSVLVSLGTTRTSWLGTPLPSRGVGCAVSLVVALVVAGVGGAVGVDRFSGSDPSSGSSSTFSTTTELSPSTAPPPTPPSPTPPLPTGPAPTGPASTAVGPTSWSADLAVLIVAEPASPDGYDRDLFDHWIDADSNRCSTRCEVLLREIRHDLDGLPNGGWLSAYDGVITGESSDLDIDHVVALREAWVSGANTWDEQRRRDFANDLTPGALHAVTASVNRSKGDRDPSEWQPPDRASWCAYAGDWLHTKVRWGLSADPLEFTNVSEMLQGCP